MVYNSLTEKLKFPILLLNSISISLCYFEIFNNKKPSKTNVLKGFGKF